MIPAVLFVAVSVFYPMFQSPVQDPENPKNVTATQDVEIAIPNMTCRGRFADSLKEHIVEPHGWVHSFTAHYPTSGPASGMLAGDTATPARLVFKIDADQPPEQLVRVLKASPYYDTRHWQWIQRRKFSEIQ